MTDFLQAFHNFQTHTCLMVDDCPSLIALAVILSAGIVMLFPHTLPCKCARTKNNQLNYFASLNTLVSSVNFLSFVFIIQLYHDKIIKK